VSLSKETWELARRREEAVWTFLIQVGGVPKDQILPATAHDVSQPVAPNDTLQGRAQNRRAVISLHPSP
jgi:flagellar motor protein MotB